MKFSVLLSVYKKEKPEYLQIALQSIVEQTSMPAEIVIVEDGPLTDQLYAVIKAFIDAYPSLFKIVPFAENRGLGLALRDGVLACSHEYIARMDTDDIAMPERFEVQINYLEQHQEIGLLGSWITEFSNDSTHPDTITKLPCKHEAILKFAKRRNPFRHMTVVFKKSAVLDSGNYRDFLWFEDYDLWVRMLQKGYLAENLPQVLVNVRADDEMFARRGGWKYLKQDVKFQREMLRSRFLNRAAFFCNVLIRSIARICPNNIRVWIYKSVLRNCY